MIMPSLKVLLWFNSSQKFNYNFAFPKGFRLRLCPSRRLHRRGDHIVGATRAGRADRPGPDVGRDRQVRISRTDLGRTQTRAKINDGISHSIRHRWVSDQLQFEPKPKQCFGQPSYHNFFWLDKNTDDTVEATWSDHW